MTDTIAFPAAPALGNLRVASPADILRIGIVATAGFRYSPLFGWERPHHAEFPEDTLLSYRTQFKDAVRSDEVIVLVAEDSFEPHENDATEAIIPPNNGWKAPKGGEKVIVGVASIKLEPGSKRKGQFECHEGTYPELPQNLGRDLNRKHYDSWGSKVGAAKKEHCSGYSFMSMLVVHPAYWKHGHGTQLVKWGVELSRIDSVVQGVSAAGMGKTLYTKHGYHKICEIRDEGDKDDPKGVSTDLLKYDPSVTESSAARHGKVTG